MQIGAQAQKGHKKVPDYRYPIFQGPQNDEDNELLKRYRFHRDGIDFICQLIGDELNPPNSTKRGLPVPTKIQVNKFRKKNSWIFPRFWHVWITWQVIRLAYMLGMLLTSTKQQFQSV